MTVSNYIKQNEILNSMDFVKVYTVITEMLEDGILTYEAFSKLQSQSAT